MSTTENNTNDEKNSKVTLKPSPDSNIITPLTGLADEQPNETLVTLGEAMPTEYSIKPSPEPSGHDVYNVVKHDMRSSESRRRDYELKRQATIDRIKESLRHNRRGGEIVSEFDQDLPGEMMAEMVREARDQLQREVSEAEEIREDRRAEFQRRLQDSRFVCSYCNFVGGWDEYAEDRHYQVCSAYQQHKKAEEDKMLRRRNFVQRYEKLLEFDLQRAVSSVSDVVNTINDLRWQENEAKYTTHDSAITEGLQRVKEKIGSESDYDRRRRHKQVADLRTGASAIEALYRRLDETEPQLEQS